jgi:hypothetical protein
MGKGAVEVSGVVALPEQENLPELARPLAHRTDACEQKEITTTLPHVLEGNAQLIDIDGTLAPWGRVIAVGIEFVAGAAGSELVSSDATEVSGVHEQLVLGDANRKDVGHVVVGNRVAIALPVDESVDAAEAVDHSSRVVGMAGQGHQLVALFGEPIERCTAMAKSVVCDA